MGGAMSPSEVEMIVVKEGRYFSAQWFALGAGWDLLVALWRDPGEPWVVQGRVRTYVDGRAHDSDDVKDWFAVELSGPTCDELVASLYVERFLSAVVDRAEVRCTLIRSDDVEVVAAALAREPQSHFGETVWVS